MSISSLPREKCAEALELFNGVIKSDNLCYRTLDIALFEEKFITETDTVKKINLIFSDDDKITGFINGSYKPGSEGAYLTFVAVDSKNRRRGIGRALIDALHEKFRETDSNIKKVEILFFNPIMLEWIVPGTKSHDHNNSPGMDVSIDAYIFLKNMDYRDFSYQNSFYMPLKNYSFSDDVKNKLNALKERGLNVCYYDSEKHFGFKELCDDLDSEDWRNHIFGNLEREKPDPLLIVEDNGKICGFTGPLRVQESGRGFFAGIGMHSEYRGGGSGTALFASLCMGLREMGAEYMTLFTGEANPARNIYRAAGFKIVKSWVNMRKEL
ncbi:MAG: GNAT family N-acetyltransferase [Treponema sp.]|nr:GNAT family N-acetyltransferase [Treponema sp.]